MAAVEPGQPGVPAVLGAPDGDDAGTIARPAARVTAHLQVSVVPDPLNAQAGAGGGPT